MHIPSDNIIVSEIIKSLDKALEEINNTYLKVKKISNQGWINILFSYLSKAGKNLGCDVSPDIGTVNPTWLYDQMWETRMPRNEALLVVECVWSKVYMEIKNDFTKLLMSNAELRLFISYGGDHEKDKERAFGIVERLKKRIELDGISETGERFLFATIIRDTNGRYTFHYEYFEKG